MFDDKTLVSQMLANINRIMENDKEYKKCSAVVVYHRNKRDYDPIINMIKSYDTTDSCNDLFRVAVVTYKKYVFTIGISYYSAGRAVVMLKLPNDEAPIVLPVKMLNDPDLFDNCYDICEFAEANMRHNKEPFEIEKVLDKYSEWWKNQNKSIPDADKLTTKDVLGDAMEHESFSDYIDKNGHLNKGLHKNKKICSSDTEEAQRFIDRIIADDEIHNIINEYNELYNNDCNSSGDEKIDILMSNLMAFDMGTIQTVEQLTNLTLLMYYDYMYNDKLEKYDPNKDSEESFLIRCNLKAMLRQFDLFLDSFMYAMMSNSQFIEMNEIIEMMTPELENLREGYGIKQELKLYYDRTMLGVYDMDKDMLIFQKNLQMISYVGALFSPNARSFTEHEEQLKPFISTLTNKTKFFDIFLGVVFTDPLVLRKMMKNGGLFDKPDNND